MERLSAINSTKRTTGFGAVISRLALTRLSFPRACEEAGASKERLEDEAPLPLEAEAPLPLEAGASWKLELLWKLEGICSTGDLCDAFIQVI